MGNLSEQKDVSGTQVIKGQPGSLTRLYRGFTYALTSCMALYAGYLLGVREPTADQSLLLLAPFIASVSFFVVYAICFGIEKEGSRPESDADQNGEWQDLLRGEGAKSPAIFTLLLAIIILAIRRIQYGSVTYIVLINISIYTFLFYAYGIFLYRRFSKPKTDVIEVIVRHELVYPVILSIALPLYFGMHLVAFTQSFVPWWPFSIILLMGAFSEYIGMSSRNRANISIVIYFIVYFVSSLLSGLGVIDETYLLSTLFCISIAAYLAVFESWRITVGIRAKEVIGMDLKSKSDNNNILSGTSHRYYRNTYKALMVSVMAIPFLFIFSSFTSTFLYGFAITAGMAFLLWHRAEMDLLKFPWAEWKLILGFAVLTILVLDSRFPWEITARLMKGLVSFPFLANLSGFTAISIALSVALYREFLLEIFKGKSDWRDPYIALNLFASLGLCLIILIVQEASPNTVVVVRGDRAFILYILAFSVSWLYLFSRFFSGGRGFGVMITSIVGIVSLIRMFTSMIIGAAVFLPALHAGLSVPDSLLLSLPFLFTAAGGFALNDYFDVVRDELTKPFRAIPSGRVSMKGALSIAVTLLLMSVIFIVVSFNDVVGTSIQISAIVGVVVYNWIVVKVSWAKGAFTALLCISPVLFDICQFNYVGPYWLLPLGAALFIFGREVLMDILDSSGDSATGLNTIPMIMGNNQAMRLGVSSIVAGNLCVVCMGLTSGKWIDCLLSLSMTGASIILVVLWFMSPPTYHRRVIRLMWIPMIFGLALLI